MKHLITLIILASCSAFAQTPGPVVLPLDRGTVTFRPNGSVVLQFEGLKADNCAWPEGQASPPTCEGQVTETRSYRVILRPATGDIERKVRRKDRTGTTESNE